VLPSVSYVVLEVLPPIAQMTLIFLGIVYLHDGIEDVLFLPLGRLSQYLLGGDLDGSRGAILDPCLILG
jgi:hypothetical protein